MNYVNIYLALCERGRGRIYHKKLHHKHHILPRCLGGEDHNSNFSFLTIREHYLAHKLLCEIHPENLKLKYAFKMMMGTLKKNGIRFSARDYERARKGISHSNETRFKLSQAHKLRNPESYRNMQVAAKLANAIRIRNKHSDATLQKLRGHIKTQEHRFKLSIANMGRIWTDEHRKNASNAHKGKVQSVEQIQKRISHAFKEVIQFSREEVFIKKWNSITEASRELNLYTSQICDCCKGKYKTSGGFVWKYAS